MKTQKKTTIDSIANQIKVIGIVFDDTDYKLCWAINKELNLKLVHSKNINFKFSGKSEMVNYSIFSYTDEQDKNYTLISNKFEGNSFVEKYKNFDFLFTFNSELEKMDNLDCLKKIADVRVVSKLEITPLAPFLDLLE